MALTAAQIVTRACTIAKVPGYAVQAGVYLNMLLDTLCQTYDFDYIVKTHTIALDGNTSYDLASDHLRTREAFYSVDGTMEYMFQISIEDYNKLFQGPGVANYPNRFAVDVSTTPYSFLPYPPPSVTQSVTIKYFPRMADIATPESSSTVPWFINQEYLIKKVAADLMLETDDDRAPLFEVQAEKLLRNILTMSDDKGGYAQTIQHDRSRFRTGGSNADSKAYPLG